MEMTSEPSGIWKQTRVNLEELDKAVPMALSLLHEIEQAKRCAPAKVKWTFDCNSVNINGTRVGQGTEWWGEVLSNGT